MHLEFLWRWDEAPGYSTDYAIAQREGDLFGLSRSRRLKFVLTSLPTVLAPVSDAPRRPTSPIPPTPIPLTVFSPRYADGPCEGTGWNVLHEGARHGACEYVRGTEICGVRTRRVNQLFCDPSLSLGSVSSSVTPFCPPLCRRHDETTTVACKRGWVYRSQCANSSLQRAWQFPSTQIAVST